jgi:hypothetical protein
MRLVSASPRSLTGAPRVTVTPGPAGAAAPALTPFPQAGSAEPGRK